MGANAYILRFPIGVPDLRHAWKYIHKNYVYFTGDVIICPGKYILLHSGLLSQAPVMAQAQTIPLSQQAPSLSIINNAVTSSLSPRLQFSAPPMRYVGIHVSYVCI